MSWLLSASADSAASKSFIMREQPNYALLIPLITRPTMTPTTSPARKQPPKGLGYNEEELGKLNFAKHFAHNIDAMLPANGIAKCGRDVMKWAG